MNCNFGIHEIKEMHTSTGYNQVIILIINLVCKRLKKLQTSSWIQADDTNILQTTNGI